MTSYYNEIDPFAAAWLQNLIDAGHIAPGIVDTRSIEDVSPSDLRGFTQCHFFAGIGGWSLALRLAGWPDDRPAWTGSCPCQPFSAAGKGAGFDDERHLWPAWQHLIAQCQPPVIFGEQVASKGADAWIDLVQADLEGLGYAFGSNPFPAAGVGAPHIRDRNYWMAYTDRSAGGQGRTLIPRCGDGSDAESRARLGGGSQPYGLGISASSGPERLGNQSAYGELVQTSARSSGLAHTDGRHAGAEREQRSWQHGQQPKDSGVVGMADANCRERERIAIVRRDERDWKDAGRAESIGGITAPGENGNRPGPVNGFWRDADWIGCTDGKFRPVEPGTQPLAHGIPNRVGSLRGYGNAIVPQAAEAFIRSAIEVIQEPSA